MVQWTRKLEKKDNSVIGIILEKRIDVIFIISILIFYSQKKLFKILSVKQYCIRNKQIIMLAKAYNAGFKTCLTQFP